MSRHDTPGGPIERSARPPPTDQLASARIAVATMASASSSDRLPYVFLLGWRADCLLDDAGPTPTPIGGVPLDVIRYIAAAFCPKLRRRGCRDRRIAGSVNCRSPKEATQLDHIALTT